MAACSVAVLAKGFCALFIHKEERAPLIPSVLWCATLLLSCLAVTAAIALASQDRKVIKWLLWDVLNVA
jgi:hypothetical protein